MKDRNINILISLVIIILLSIPVHSDQTEDAGDTIYLYPENVVSKNYIYLNDIADISGEPSLVQELGEMNLGLSPRVGKKKEFTGERLSSILRSNKQIREIYEIIAPARIIIKKASHEISEDEVRQIFYECILNKNPDGDIDVKNLKIRGGLIYPDGDIELVISNDDKVKPYGRTSLYIDVYVDTIKVGRISVSAWVDRYQDVVCALKNLSRGDIVTQSDVGRQKLNLARISGNFVSEISQAVGKKVKNSIKKGNPLKVKQIGPVPIVNKGDMVKLVADNGKLRIVTMGIAKYDGIKGDQVKVMNLRSKKIITGVIVDHKTIAVIF